MALVPAGPDYCRKHHGIREEDQEICDFAGDVGQCESCDGDGFDCQDCDGKGVTDCDLTPLLYDNGEDA